MPRQYAIIKALNPHELEELVNKALTEGYELQGGIAITTIIHGPSGQPVDQLLQAVSLPENFWHETFGGKK